MAGSAIVSVFSGSRGNMMPKELRLIQIIENLNFKTSMRRTFMLQFICLRFKPDNSAQLQNEMSEKVKYSKTSSNHTFKVNTPKV